MSSTSSPSARGSDSKAEKLRRELYDVLFRAPEALRDGVMSYCARQIADYLMANYTLRRRKKR